MSKLPEFTRAQRMALAGLLRGWACRPGELPDAAEEMRRWSNRLRGVYYGTQHSTTGEHYTGEALEHEEKTDADRK